MAKKRKGDEDFWKEVKFYPQGFMIYRLNIDQKNLEACNKAVQELNVSTFTQVFEKIQPSQDGNAFEPSLDEKRFQTTETLSELFPKRKFYKQLIGHLQSHFDVISENLEITDCRVLKSLPGGGVQQMHQDIVDPQFVCFAGIVAVQEGTKIWLKDFGSKDAMREIEIPVGYVLLWRGDLLHAGSAYEEKENRRIYFKVLPKGKSFDPEQIGQIEVKICWAKWKGEYRGCRKTIQAREMKNHRSFCEKIHGKTEINRRKEVKKESNKKRTTKK